MGEHINAYRNPNLCFHRVLGCAIEMFDAQILLDPFEKQFDSPALFIERGDRCCGQHKVVGQEHQTLARFWIAERDAPQVLRIVPLRIKSVERDPLVTAHACCFVNGM